MTRARDGPFQAVRAHLMLDHRVLLAKRVRGPLWTTFGGKCEPGETAEDTLRRELTEELGIIPTAFRLLRIRAHGLDGAPANIPVFVVTGWDGVPQNLALHEHESISWFDTAQLQSLTMTEEARQEATELLE